jgi:MFS family permease
LWFVQRRGIAAAAASLGLAAGSMVFPQLINSLISLWDWRGAYLGLAVLVALTILTCCADHFAGRSRTVPGSAGKVRAEHRRRSTCR